MAIVVHQERGVMGVEEVIIGKYRTETMFVDMNTANFMAEFKKRPLVPERGLQSEPLSMVVKPSLTADMCF